VWCGGGVVCSRSLALAVQEWHTYTLNRGWGGLEWGGMLTAFALANQGWHDLVMYTSPCLELQAIPGCRQISANACCKPVSTIALQHMTTIKSETTQGITRHHKASQGHKMLQRTNPDGSDGSDGSDGWMWMEHDGTTAAPLR